MSAYSTSSSDFTVDQEQSLIMTVQQQFSKVVGSGKPLFTTDASDLWNKFLFFLPEDIRRQYTCRACQKFIETYGHLVTIAEDGSITPAMWQLLPGVFENSLLYLRKTVVESKITGVFLSEEKVWGLPQNHDRVRGKDWCHIHVTPPAGCVWKPTLDWSGAVIFSASQKMAERLEEFSMLKRGLAEFPVSVIRNAHTLLTTGQLFRAEKCVEVARWLLDLQESLEGVRNPLLRDNLIWAKVATAPAGWCHVRSGMIGTLLADLVEGLHFREIQQRWDAKMNPLQYLRPQAAPSAGNITQAEKIVEALKTAGALQRRFAKLEDCVLVWKPAETSEQGGATGVFGHLRPKHKEVKPLPAVEAPPTVMTWHKFSRDVLPLAEKIELLVPQLPSSFTALVTAADPASPPVVQWDRQDRRNPVTWYQYACDSVAASWNLSAGTWCPVTGITLLPPQWYGDGLLSQGQGLILLLQGARDLYHRSGGGLFPEHLRSEYHSVRSTLESYFTEAAIQGKNEATACGLSLRSGRPWEVQIRVTSRAGRVSYKLDRWD